MNVVPVIDLLHGRVVRARRGARGDYQSIESALCRSADPVRVAEGLCEHCATDLLYVADLDALQGGAAQVGVLRALLRDAPARRLWVDAGFHGHCDVDRLLGALGADAARVTPVFASESLPSVEALAQCLGRAPDAPLSLDRRAGAALDPAALWSAPARWPPRLIVMTLDRVGSADGPDLATLAAVRALAPRAQLFGAGGVRGAADLEAAAAAGADGWLVASALHDGLLSATDCRALARGGHSVSRAAEAAPTAAKAADNGTCLA